MGVWPSSWAETCLLEGNKFWFYSLVCSILLGALQLNAGGGEAESEPNKRPKGKRQTVQAQKNDLDGVRRRIIADSFDLFIPGFVTGWLLTTHAFVGFAGAASTVLSSKDIWDRLRK
jgi:Peroxisomal biogenesis factor 11 (PEX11)